jgi:hypothetical protein
MGEEREYGDVALVYKHLALREKSMMEQKGEKDMEMCRIP